jgi:hypothetical protein
LCALRYFPVTALPEHKAATGGRGERAATRRIQRSRDHRSRLYENVAKRFAARAGRSRVRKKMRAPTKKVLPKLTRFVQIHSNELLHEDKFGSLALAASTQRASLPGRVGERGRLTIGKSFLVNGGYRACSRAADTSQPTAARAHQTFFGGRSVAKKKAVKKATKKSTKKKGAKKAAKKKK